MKATDIILLFAAALVSYLVSGLNPAIILSRAIYHKDIRTCGSGNPGFTNFKRSFGGRYAWFVFLLDIAKGAVLFLAFGLLFRHFRGEWATGVAVSAVFAMLGHAFPVWYGFRGGKGILSGWFIAWTIDWRIGLLIGVVFFVTYLITKYVSLGSVLASITFAVGFIVFQHDHVYVMAGGIFMGALCVFMHRANILRLIRGEERKTNLFGKGNKS